MIQIRAPHFCAAVIFNDLNGIVVEAAPILRYMEGWTAEQVKTYCRKKGWTYTSYL